MRPVRCPESPESSAKHRIYEITSDVILQFGDGVAVIPTLAKKITSELAEVNLNQPLMVIINALNFTFANILL